MRLGSRTGKRISCPARIPHGQADLVSGTDQGCNGVRAYETRCPAVDGGSWDQSPWMMSLIRSPAAADTTAIPLAL
jgi:hypothetical protein